MAAAAAGLRPLLLPPLEELEALEAAVAAATACAAALLAACDLDLSSLLPPRLARLALAKREEKSTPPVPSAFLAEPA